MAYVWLSEGVGGREKRRRKGSIAEVRRRKGRQTETGTDGREADRDSERRELRARKAGLETWGEKEHLSRGGVDEPAFHVAEEQLVVALGGV